MKTKQYSGNKSLAISLIIALIVCFTLFGCGTRKVEKSKTEITKKESTQSTKIDTSKTVTITESNIKTIDTSSSEETIIEPLDPEKEMIVNGKIFKNAILKTKKSKTNKLHNENVIVSENKENAITEAIKTEKENNTSIETKKSERESNFPWWVILIIMIIAWILVYREFKKAQ